MASSSTENTSNFKRTGNQLPSKYEYFDKKPSSGRLQSAPLPRRAFHSHISRPEKKVHLEDLDVLPIVCDIGTNVSIKGSSIFSDLYKDITLAVGATKVENQYFATPTQLNKQRVFQLVNKKDGQIIYILPPSIDFKNTKIDPNKTYEVDVLVGVMKHRLFYFKEVIKKGLGPKEISDEFAELDQILSTRS